jgi:formate hydrogenlyase transcriptional activator
MSEAISFMGSSESDRVRLERDALSLLLDVTNLLLTHRDLPSLFHSLSDCIGRVIPHDYACVATHRDHASDPRRLKYELIVVDGTRRPELEARELIMSNAFAAHMAAGQPLVFDVEYVQQNNPPLANVFRSVGLRSFCALPLRTARRTVGILNVGSRQVDAFIPPAVQLLRQISGQIAIAMENAGSYAELEALKERLANEKLYLEEEVRSQHGFMDIVGNSRALREVLAQVETVAPTDATVLLLGETGTGKELLARAVHDRSLRRRRPFVKVNCAAIPPPLLEGEMFGHERGAFTGAVAARVGRLEIADSGTFFLDEVGDLPLEIQAKMLRALQEHEFERLGSSRTVRVDVRVIAATNRHLGAMVESGQFRADLFYRLNVFPIWIPPLRERPDDIPALVRYLVAKHAKRLKRSIVTVPMLVMDELVANEWPGNVRELENVIERAVILSTEGSLRLPPSRAAVRRPRMPEREPLSGRLEDIERHAILAALSAANGVISGNGGAAAKLGLKRTTLQSRMRKLGIQRRYQ